MVVIVVVVASMLDCSVWFVGCGGVVVNVVVTAAVSLIVDCGSVVVVVVVVAAVVVRSVVVGSVVVVGVAAGIAVDGGMANVRPWIGSRGTVPKPAPLPSRYTSRV